MLAAHIITIIGLLPFDSGKTRLTVRLLRYLREIGANIYASKPIGSHNIWGQEFSLRYSIENGVLVGGDAIRIAEALNEAKPEALQFMDTLLVPRDSAKYTSRIREFVTRHESLLNQAVALRYTKCSENGSMTYAHVFSLEKLYDTPPTLARVVRELYNSIKSKGNKVVDVESKLFDEVLTSPQLVSEADYCARIMAKRREIFLIESFNDAVVPIPLTLRSRLFLAVSPGRVIVYEGSDIAKAVEVVSSLRPTSVRSSEVLSLVKPLKVFELDYVDTDYAPGHDIEDLAEYILKAVGSS